MFCSLDFQKSLIGGVAVVWQVSGRAGAEQIKESRPGCGRLCGFVRKFGGALWERNLLWVSHSALAVGFERLDAVDVGCSGGAAGVGV